MKILNIFFVFIAAIHQPNSGSGRLMITIENIKEPKGQLIVALFNSNETYLKKDFRSQKVDVRGESQEITFEQLPEGNYSVSIIYDKNRNGELDTNFMGIPTEGFGFSRKSMGTFGAPSYEATKVKINGDTLQLAIPLKYLL